MKNLHDIHTFLKTDNDQSSFFESHLNADDVDYHGQILNIKKDIENEQGKLALMTKVDHLNNIMKSINDVINGLNELNINTKGLQDVYYKIAAIAKSLS